MAMEPFGESTRGLDEVWLFDADTNERKVFSTGRETLLGPERAVGIVRSEDSRTNWAGADGDGQFKVVEPIPVVVDSQLWWHTKVSPTDNTDVTRNVFVNADTEEAIELGRTEDVVSFLNGASVSTQENGTRAEESEQTETATTASGDDIGYVIVVRDESGTVVDRIRVPQNQTATIESAQANTTVTTSTASASSTTNNSTS